MGCAIRTGFSSRGEPANIGFMESQLDWHNARALLEWQVDLGATEAIQEQPVDRFALDPAPVKAPEIMPNVAKPPAAPQVPAIDSVAVARRLAKQSQTLEGRMALEKRVAKYTAKFNVGTIPRPDFWSGFRLRPVQIELWKEEAFRLHDRTRYKRDGDGWTVDSLYP